MRKPHLSPRGVAEPSPVAPPPRSEGLDAFGVEDVGEALEIAEAREVTEALGPRRVAERPKPPIDETSGLDAFWSEAVRGPASDEAGSAGDSMAPSALEEFGVHETSIGVEPAQRRPSIVVVPPPVAPTTDPPSMADAPIAHTEGVWSSQESEVASVDPILETLPPSSGDWRPVDDAELVVEHARHDWRSSVAGPVPAPVIAPVVRARYAPLALGAVGFAIGAALVVVVLDRLEDTSTEQASPDTSVAQTTATAPRAVEPPPAGPVVDTTASGNTRVPAPGVTSGTTGAVAPRAASAPPAPVPAAPQTPTQAVAPSGRSQTTGAVPASPVSPAASRTEVPAAPANLPPPPTAPQPSPSAPLPEMIATAAPVTRTIVVQPEAETRPPAPAAVVTPPPAIVPATSAPLTAEATPPEATRQVVAAPTPRPAAAEATASSAASPATMAATRTANDEAAIRRALEGYRSAYNTLNASGARAVWPSVDVATLSKAFEQLESQSLEFSSCQIAVTGDSARAVCGGSASFVPKVGRRSPRRDSREWRFTMQRSNDRWVIGRMDMR